MKAPWMIVGVLALALAGAAYGLYRQRMSLAEQAKKNAQNAQALQKAYDQGAADGREEGAQSVTMKAHNVEHERSR